MRASEPGLRELKKQMTRENIADSALQLTLEKGLDHVTVDEIAQRAFVSPRTVSNYFSGKEEAVISAGEQEWFTIVYDFGERPADEPPLQSLCEVVTAFARSRSRAQLDLIIQKAELTRRYPTLQPFQAAQYDKLEESLREAIALRTGTESEVEMYPWLVAGAAVCALRAALRLWVRDGAEGDTLVELLQRAFNQISDGLPAPQVHASSPN